MRAKPKSIRAPLGVALIARNAAETLPTALASIRPYVAQIVVGVDETTTDKTRKAARRAGADVVFPVQVSDWHECPQHGRILAQHFARARNESFRHLDRALPWWMWLDADDVLQGGAELADVLPAVPEDCVGVWLPYHYATLNAGALTNTLFDRERILRSGVGWRWEHRVHEVVVPQNQNPRWIRSDAVKIYHQEGVHRSESSASRNLRLLEIELEESPNEPRTLFYLGNQYFALGDWPAAAHWYERLCEVGGNPYELWQSYVYLSMAYERLGDLDSSLKAAFGGIDVRPEHPDPYYRLASVYLAAGEFEKALYWTNEGRRKTEPPFFVFKNPLDGPYNSRMVAADALGQLGRVSEARAELEQAYAVVQNAEVAAAIARYRALEDGAEQANAFVRLTAGKPDADVVSLYETTKLPPNVTQFGRIRNVVVPAMLRQRPSTQPRIVFFCGRTMEEWYPGTLNTTGIGGSETAVVYVADRFAREGWRVDVFGSAGRYEGVHGGVGYWDAERYRPDPVDLFVSWRRPDVRPLASGRANLLWLHDLNYGPEATEHIGQWEKVLGVSSWHAGMLRRYYDLPPEKADFVPNGIDLARFERLVGTKKHPFRCVYASSPDRALARLLSLWPRITADEPGAELQIAYGWENVDKAIAAGRGDLAAMKAEIVGLLEKTPQVQWLGRLPQAKLAELFASADAWLYPTSFLEVSCITAMEAMAAGCVPVTSAVGALRETIDGAGVLVTGSPDSQVWGDLYVHAARGVLASADLRHVLAPAGQQRARSLTWEAAFERWKGIVANLLRTPADEALIAEPLSPMPELIGVAR